MTRGEWRKAQVEAARNDDVVSARYRRESKVDWWAVAATERAYQLRQWVGRNLWYNDAGWMVPMIRGISGRAREAAR